MKIRILLLIILIPLTMLAEDSFLYNKGLISIAGSDTTKTSLFVKGDMVVGTDATNDNITSNIILTNSKVVLTGNFRNNVKTGNVFSRASDANKDGVFEFRSDPELNKAQFIKTDGVVYATIPSKRTSFINFPNLKINNSNHVTIAPEIGVKTKDIDLSKGWLILDSRKVNQSDYNLPMTSDLEHNRSILAHLFVDGNVYYKGWNRTNVNERGFIEVNLRLDDISQLTDGERSLTAFGSPFSNMKADYFMWNFLVAPSASGFFGDTGAPVVDPRYTLQAGRGYVVGIDLRGSDYSQYQDIDPEYNNIIAFDQRATDGYYFNRFRFSTDENRKANQLFGSNQEAEAYQIEKLNTEDITVSLQTGFNYLANPYTTPLDISDLLGSNTAQDWSIVADNSDNINRDLLNRIWVMKGDASATSISEGSTWIRFTYNYYLAKSVGGTYTDEDDGVTLAPLQMFVVRATKPTQITIPKSKRATSRSQFIRSGRAQMKKQRKDDFIIEINDETTRTSDRVSFVLRYQNDLLTNKEYENVKRLATTSVQGASTRATQLEGVVEQTVSSQIYTGDSEGSALTVQFFPIETTYSTIMYLTPSEVEQNISLRGLRFNTMSEIEGIWLEDKLEGAVTQLTAETIYTTRSRPTDPIDRFVLHFKDELSVGVDENVIPNSITSYYANEILTVSGLNNSDMGSVISIFDLQGREMKQVEVDDIKMIINVSLPQGPYIVKVTGNRLYQNKFIAR